MKVLAVNPVGAPPLPDPLKQIILKSGVIAADMHDRGRRPGLQNLQKVMDLAVPAVELRAFQSDAVLSAATKCCNLPGIALVWSVKRIPAFILSNAERAKLTTITQHRSELDPFAPKLEPARFGQTRCMKLQ